MLLVFFFITDLKNFLLLPDIVACILAPVLHLLKLIFHFLMLDVAITEHLGHPLLLLDDFLLKFGKVNHKVALDVPLSFLPIFVFALHTIDFFGVFAHLHTVGILLLKIGGQTQEHWGWLVSISWRSVVIGLVQVRGDRSGGIQLGVVFSV